MLKTVVKIVLGCQTLAWSSGCASRSEGEIAAASNPQPFPVSFENSQIDLGTVQVRSNVSFQLGLRNAGALPAKLLSLSPGCGCTVLDDHPDTIPANALITIEGTLDVPQGVGRFSKPVSANIQVNGETRSISAFLVADIAPSPRLHANPNSIELGKIGSGSPLERSFVISRFDGTPLGPLSVTASSESIRWEIVPLADKESAASGWRVAKVLVTVAPGLPAGAFLERLDVSTTDGESIELFLRAEVAASIAGIVPRVFVKSLVDEESILVDLAESENVPVESVELRKVSKPLVRLDESPPRGPLSRIQLSAVGDCQTTAVVTGELVVRTRDKQTSVIPLVVIRKPSLSPEGRGRSTERL